MKKFKRISASFILFGILIFAIVCSSIADSESTIQDENLSTLESVLENTFTGPNKELTMLLEDPENLTVIGEDGENNSPENPTKLDLFLESMYQPHFTQDMYNEYIGKYALSYFPPESSQMIVGGMEVEQKNAKENIYDFIVSVQFQKEGNESKVYKIVGQTNFSKEGKIVKLKISSDNGLSSALREY